MGVVYTARAAKLGRVVALKFLPPQWSHDDNAKQRFLREAQAASATNHPNICTIHDIETAGDGQLFIVMAYYEGQTLKQRLESGPLPVEQALDLATQVAEGLAKAHAQGVVHRDIKPGNLILTEDGVRILDFGLATFADALKLTAENTAVGTIAYMSPEQVRGLAVDARTDVWAVGAVLYEMLTGHPPFRGSHAEAIGFAIRNETPTPIRSVRPEIPEEIEQLVFRALHKEPPVRHASGRELARALRHVRGLSVPTELRSQTVQIPALAPAPAKRSNSFRTYKRVAIAFVGMTAVAIGAIAWPVDRTPVVVTLASNQTGRAELDPYLPALTAELIDQIVDADGIRVLPHDRVLQITRRFRQESGNAGSRDALQAIARRSGARVFVMPIVVYESGAWSLRVEFRNPETGTRLGAVETSPEKSSLTKDVVYRHAAAVSVEVEDYLARTGSRRTALRHRLRGLLRRAPPPRLPRLRSLDAAALFERGIDAYEQLELAAARTAFAAAAGQDPRSPILLAWRSRIATLLRQDREAADAAESAQRLLRGESRPRDRLWVEAIAAESRRDQSVAEAKYRDLIARYEDEPIWLLELAGYLDRRGSASEAVEAYHQALTVDQGLLIAHLELCRLYSPSRLNERALAKEQGELTLTLARDLGNRSMEARALMCLTDVLRSGTDAERKEARRNAEEALSIVEQLQYPFGTALASNYVSIVALLAERNATRAVPLLERALAAAREVGFVRLEMRVLMNLAVAHEALGYRALALKEYRQGTKLAEDVGSQQDAAYNQVNAAAILIDYSADPDAGLRDAENALGVFQQTGEKDFEAHARQVIASYHRRAGNHDESTRNINLGLDIARQHGLEDKQARLTIELAKVRFDLGDYPQARDLLRQSERFATGQESIPRRVELARTLARLGDFETSLGDLIEMSSEIDQAGDLGARPLVEEALGELDYEMGRTKEAHAHFLRSSNAWLPGELIEETSVAARAYVGLLVGLGGNVARGRSEILDSLAWARRTHRIALQAQCLIFLARVALSRGDDDEALLRLDEMPGATSKQLNPELQAQMHYWRSQALERRGERDAAAAARSLAREVIATWRKAFLSSRDESGVQLRPDLRLIVGDKAAERP